MPNKAIHFLEHLDRRWVFLLMAVAVIMPIIFQVIFPEQATDLVQVIYDRIEEMPKGSKILLAFDYDPGSEPELQPMATGVTRHCSEKGHKLYFLALWPVGPAMIENTINEVIKISATKVLEEVAALVGEHPKTLKDVDKKVADEGLASLSDDEKKILNLLHLSFLVAKEMGGLDPEAIESDVEIDASRIEAGIREIEGKILSDQALMDLKINLELKVENRSHREMKYGVDYVNLGFKPGNEGVIKVIITDLKKLYTTDHYGTNIDDIEMTRGISSIQDMDLILNISAGYPGTKEWVQYAAEPYNVPIASGCTGVQAPLLYPYIPEPLFGLMGGVKGAAEFEAALRIGYPKFDDDRLNKGVQRMGPQMVAHLAILLLIVLGNITYFATRKTKRGQGT
ncbi:MAG: hypothetical protein O7H41_19065 [Planctomycetota bacterium]|nr:hypothetical protein [Planctomycetota bacterium]